MKKNRVIVAGKAGISVEVIAHSAHPNMVARQLLTFQLRYPRFVHAELLTHRALSRNSSSSRAIPVAKVLKQVREDPAIPFHWGINQPGMQADNVLGPQEAAIAETYWRESARRAADMAECMLAMNLHKQVINRILEPYQFMSVIVTATEWDNFFELRDHPDAEPHIRELAQRMREAWAKSEPTLLQYGDWHLPYVLPEELKKHGVEVCRKLSAARCARVSYLTHDGEKPDVKKDLELFDRLVGSVPLHASPIEHQATPMQDIYTSLNAAHCADLQGNLRDWIQFRKLWEQKVANGVFPQTGE